MSLVVGPRNTNSILNKIECCLFHPNIIFKMTKVKTRGTERHLQLLISTKREPQILQNTSVYPEDTNKEANILT